MLESYNNHCGPNYHHPHPGDDKILYAKTPYATYEAALEALRTRNLAPGQLAVVRYYLGDASNWPNACGMPTRALLGIGGSNPTTGFDVYVFEDNAANITYTTVNGDILKFSRIEDAIYYILDNLGNSGTIDLSNYPTKDDLSKAISNVESQISEKADASTVYTKSEVDALIGKIPVVDASKFVSVDDFNNKVEEIDNNLGNKVDASTVYTKSEVDELVNKIPIIDETEFVKNDIFDASIKSVYDELSDKVDASYVENYFNTNIETEVNRIITETNIPGIVEDEIKKQDITKQVSDAVDEKLKDIEGVTTKNIADVLQKDAYFTTNVINPIQTLETEVQTLKESMVTSIDGGEEDEWEMN